MPSSTLKKYIFNLDQVPRYFEREGKYNLAFKGSKEVKLAKGSTSRKRFTYTPVVTTDGKFTFQHILFSGLKNIPRVDNRNIIVQVNSTGMWNMDHIRNFVSNHFAKRTKTAFLRKHVIFILDSYGLHLNLDVTRLALLYRIHVIFIPKCMTSILQPLDVCINRSFQQFYDDKYESHLELALSKPSTDMTYYTSQGNIKIPTYNQVTNWCVDFSNNFDTDLIKKAFEVCGIGCLDRERYHHKLKDLLENNLCLEEIVNP